MASLAATWDVSEAAPRIGTIIRTDKDTLLSGAKATEIREIMEARGVVVFTARCPVITSPAA